MSTPELPGSTPGEAGLVAAELPKATQTPATPGFTPGVSPGATKVPQSPTLPDWDQSLLLSLVSRIANESFFQAPASAAAQAPPSAASPAPLTLPTPSLPGPPAAAAPAPIAPTFEPAPAPAPATATAIAASTPDGAAQSAAAPQIESSSPFAVPPRLDNLEAPGFPFPAFPSLPLVDFATPWQATVPRGPEAAPALNIETFEIDKSSDLSLRHFAGTPFDAHAIRREFPILQERVHGRPLVWLDNAATTQKPRAVIERLSYFYEHENSNIHRAAHTLAARATDAYESARESVRRFINAPSKNEIVFVRGATEGINLVAQTWGKKHVQAGDEIVLTWLEHHANIVPWQQLCSERGARLRIAPVDDRGVLILEEYARLLGPKTRLVAFPQVSNALGTVTPARELTELAHRHGAKVLVDGAQGISHLAVDVQALDCDFYVFSGHKVFAPTGIGVVYGKRQLLESMPPWQGGGNMIEDVSFEQTRYQGPPARFEAGTGSIADAVGLGAALDWLSRIGVENVGLYEHELLLYATERLLGVPGLSIIGTAPEKAGVISFVLAGQKTEAVGGLLDKEGIAVRSGHHCAQPILRRFGLEATVRASLAPYNTYEDIDALVAALERLQVSQRGADRV